MKRASLQLLAAASFASGAIAITTPAISQPAASKADVALDYDYYKAKVEPVFLVKREGHTRCVVCHTVNNAPLHLVRRGRRVGTMSSRVETSSWSRRWSCPGGKAASSLRIRSPKRLVAIPITAEASSSPHNPTRIGKR